MLITSQTSVRIKWGNWRKARRAVPEAYSRCSVLESPIVAVTIGGEGWKRPLGT